MALKEELKLKRGFDVVEHEAMLNIYYTTASLKKRADAFFKTLGLTDVQFNVMMLLSYQGGGEGLSQVQLSDMMLVNRANVTTLIDRMEKTSLVERTSLSGDRRTNIIKMTTKGKKVFEKAEPMYDKIIKQAMTGFGLGDLKKLISILEKVRENINGN
ncbi:MAG: MarR family transcriptional regulator [Planctomycetaceae bacterium]|nr:MarR family transcriptional regulator [Planctomycetaceae bacterium]